MIVSLSAFKGKAASYLVLPLHMFTRSNFQEPQIFLISYQGEIVWLLFAAIFLSSLWKSGVKLI